ncbi:hypothetical protein C0Z16_11005 [Paraburkholderia rhynchosiae]|nr:hypothetical protein C0Z16_11005 [Paraburkholderia rhynchosiae]
MFRSKAVVPIRPKRSDDKSWFQPVNIRPGQIAIRFDLGLAVQDDLILKGQIDAAAAVLERQLSKFRKAKGISEKAGRNRKRAQVLLQLRILDALAIEATHAHHANLVWGPDTSEKKFVDAMKSALDMAQEGYLSLAAIGNKVPTVK